VFNFIYFIKYETLNLTCMILNLIFQIIGVRVEVKNIFNHISKICLTSCS